MMQSMQSEMLRLSTFSRFPATPPVFVTPLAHCGFYCMGKIGRVRCFSCGREYENYLHGTPLESAHDHQCRRHQQNIPLYFGTQRLGLKVLTEFFSDLQNLTTNIYEGYEQGDSDSEFSSDESRARQDSDDEHNDNQPQVYNSQHGSPTSGTAATNVSGHDNRQSSQKSEAQKLSNYLPSDVTAANGAGSQSSSVSHNQNHLSGSAVYQENSEPARSAQVLTSSTKTPASLRSRSHQSRGSELGASGDHNSPLSYDLSKASYPQFAAAQARRMTYANWRREHTHQPEDLVPAGFFYAGYADCVRCFYCGLGLKYWREDDIPAYQHARFRPGCVYNRMYKGQDYIDRVQQDFTPESEQVAVSQGTSENKSVSSAPNAVTAHPDVTSSNLTDDFNSDDSSDSDSGYGAGDDESRSVPKAKSTGEFAEKHTQQMDANKELRCVEREHTYLKKRTICNVCDDKPVNCVYLSCGHVIACQGCADEASKCSLCNRTIVGTANVFFA